MKRLLTLLALAGLSAAAGACGDDSGDDGDTKPTPTNDAGKTDASTKPPVRPVQITNLADKCEEQSDCTGPGSVECLSDLMGTEIPGGYCTAECNYKEECGTKGGCPVAEIIDSAAGLLAAFGGADALRGLIPQNCIETCTVSDAGGRGDCTQADHVCTSLSSAMGAGGGAGGIISSIPGLGNSAALKASYCFPMVEFGDAGVRNDAGARALRVTGLDAGI
jgi:hypothetical protein